MPFAKAECARSVDGLSGLVTEAWGQGFMVGGLTVLFFLVLSSLRRRVLLHKLIAIEVVIATTHGTFIFINGGAGGWYTSVTAVFLYLSYNLHNVINWIKIRPFLENKGSWIYIGTLVLVWPYWVVVMWLNFEYNNDLGNNHFPQIRPWEALCREPWWLFTTGYLLFVIQKSYSCGILQLIRASAKFGILILVMGISICFIIADIVTVVVFNSPCKGQNPFWKIALVCKCLADALFLDDFKSVLDRLTIATSDNGRGLEVQKDTGLPEDVTQSRHAIAGKLNNPNSQHFERPPEAIQDRRKRGTREWFDTVDLDWPAQHSSS